MRYQINFKAHKTFLEVKVDSLTTTAAIANEVLLLLKKIANECQSKKLNRILINWHTNDKISKDQSLILISNLENNNWKRSFKTASVHHNYENFRSNFFTQDVANTLQWDVKFFNNEDEARDWLISD